MTAYDEGRQAFLDGQALSQCPYARQSLSWRLWRNGWADAERAASEALSGDNHADHS